jgi:hypothetical protein
MRGRWVSTVIAVAVVVGCGGSDSSSDDEAAVRDAVTGFYAALENKDGERACAALTKRARDEIVSIDGSGGSCKKELVAQFGGAHPPRITEVEIDGSEAKVQLQNGEGGNATLVKQGDRWLMDSV